MSAPSDCGENREGRSGWDTWAGGSEQRRVGGFSEGNTELYLPVGQWGVTYPSSALRHRGS